MTLKFDIELLMASIQTAYMRPRALLLTVADSTNKIAGDLLLDGAEEGTFVLAAQQSAGTGRKGRTWYSPLGGLYMSVIIRPPIGLETASLITFLTGCAVVSTLEEVAGLNTCLKWPNDILVGDRKVSGVLCELVTRGGSPLGVVVGVGLNLNTNLSYLPDEVSPRATSVLHETGRKIPLEHVAGELITELDRRLIAIRDTGSFSGILDEWRRHNCTLGRPVRVDDESGSFTGIALDITTEGALIVRKTDGTDTQVTAADVSLV